jgi:hypothetical protein
VEEIAGKKPEIKARVEIVPVGAIQQVERPIQVEAPQFNRQDSIGLPDVREEIRSRIESFRAHQHRFHRERNSSGLVLTTSSRIGIIGPRRLVCPDPA